jgi:hypothetical protein
VNGDLTGPRPTIAEPIKQAIRDAFAVVPEGKSSALLAIVDTHGARLHVAWKVNQTWKVGGQVGIPFGGKAYGSVSIEAAW